MAFSDILRNAETKKPAPYYLNRSEFKCQCKRKRGHFVPRQGRLSVCGADMQTLGLSLGNMGRFATPVAHNPRESSGSSVHATGTGALRGAEVGTPVHTRSHAGCTQVRTRACAIRIRDIHTHVHTAAHTRAHTQNVAREDPTTEPSPTDRDADGSLVAAHAALARPSVAISSDRGHRLRPSAAPPGPDRLALTAPLCWRGSHC